MFALNSMAGRMTTEQDVEYNRIFLNAQGPVVSQSAGRGTQIVELHEKRSLEQRVGVTVLRADHVPSIKKCCFLKRKVFVIVSNTETMAKSVDAQVEGQMARWNQDLGSFVVQPSSQLTLRLYAKRSVPPDILIGTHEIRIPPASQSDIPCVLDNNVGGAARSTQPVTLYISVTVAPPNLYNSSSSIPTKAEDSPAVTIPEHVQFPVAEHVLPLSHHQSIAAGNTIPAIPHSLEEKSPTGVESSRFPLHRADEAMKRIVPIDRSNTWEGAVVRIKWVMDMLGPIAEISPFAKMAHGLLLAIPKTLLEQYQRDDSVQTLLRAVHDAFDFSHHEDTLKSIKPESEQARILTLMLQDVCSCCDFIQSYSKDAQFWKRTLKDLVGGPEEKIKELSDVLISRRKAFLDQATISTEITAFQILDDVTKLSAQLQYLTGHVSDGELDAKIREIPYGLNSRFSPEKGCLMGTRVAFLEFIINWANDPALEESERGLIIFGQAGTGKSSIAHEIARLFDKMKRLTSSFVFLRREQSERKAYHLFTTIARDLADRYPSFKIALGNVVKDNTALRVGTRDYPTLFESLILEPLKDLHIVGPILVVIDALDESGDVTGRAGLHTFLAKNLKRLPSNFRVVITSRPEHAILTALVEAESFKVKYMNDSELAAETHNDILTFLREKLPTDKLGDYVEALAVKAEGVFQWAAVASQLILDPPEHFDYSEETCIKHLLEPSTIRRGQDLLDELYKEVLEVYFKDEEARDLFRSVVGQLITSIEPLTIRSFINLRKHAFYKKRSDAAVTGLLRRLGSLLSNVNSPDNNLPIIPLHTSFRDFLTNKDKSGDFFVGVRDAHHQLAHSCFNLLTDPFDGVKFNICKLETSYLANDDVEDINTRVDEHIPLALSYACRFWGDHLKHTDFKTNLFGKVETLFKEKFLFWLETLSLTRNIGLAPSTFASLNMWLASNSDSQRELEGFSAFVNDAAIFVRHFGMAMAKSAPHIYLSALPFAPACSLVSTHYSISFSQILHVERGQLRHWPSSEMTISNFGAALSVAYSPDGQHIVAASGVRIRVWNAATGEMVAGPFTGHTDHVYSVAFSPDGQHVASGSRDGTIRVWNATTGETVAGPFTGHTDHVNSVAFSPDGRHVVSGSDDRTIRVWDATTGEIVAEPFTEHTFWVNTVAFSPDGQHIVSGSDDRTVLVYNAMTGEIAAGPFFGHRGAINTVEFSPDGQRIVSSSNDKTIRVWDAITGETAAGPLTGHTQFVRCAAFSPDGRHIVSGSDDGNVRVWNAITGEAEAEPFTGHAHFVRSAAFSPDGQHIVSGSSDGTIRVWNAMTEKTAASPYIRYKSAAFSPDGQYIVSGSDDGTIRVWNAVTGEIAAGPFIGHTDWVNSAAFSPDGQRIASGSDDGTIRVWNAATGETVAGPFTGRMSNVYSVAFSPDGQHIVSGSHDRKVRVWNAATGEQVAEPFIGHKDRVNSVAFSPDGQRIASCSSDGTVRLWNAKTGETAGGPFAGHTDQVRSLAFSLDGQHIASGSHDRTVRVWSVKTGEPAAGPITGHTAWVSSVALSPDGRHVVSGSDDGTILMWNAMTGETAAGPFTGHTGWVSSVAFSPDGRHFVSSSHDGTIRMWNATMGGKAAGLYVRREDSAASLAFSSKTTTDFDFADHFMINDEGWICGGKGELFMWIPSVHREYFRRTIWVSGKRGTILNLSNFVHGHGWTNCINTRY